MAFKNKFKRFKSKFIVFGTFFIIAFGLLIRGLVDLIDLYVPSEIKILIAPYLLMYEKEKAERKI